MKVKLLSENIIFISSFFIFCILLIVKKDFWDGDAIEYAINIQNLDGLKYWFFSSGWHLQYYFILIENFVSSTTGIHFKFIDDLINFLSIYIIFKESNVLVKNLFPEFLNNRIILFNIILFLSPIWSLLLSSVLSFHFFSFALFLYSIRKFNNTNNNLYLLLVFLSFGLKSLLFFSPLYNYFIFGKNFKKSLKILLLAIFYFLINILLLPNSGEFLNENYNDLNLNINSILANFFKFFSLIFPVLILIFRKFRKGISLKSIELSILLFLIAITPYILVGKSSFLLSFHHWELRQSLLIIFIIPLIYSLIIYKNKLFIIVFFMVYPLFTFYGYAIKINNNIYENDLLIELKNNELISDYGLVNLSTDFSTRLKFSSNEINNLFIEDYPNTFFYNTDKELEDYYKNFKNEKIKNWKIYPKIKSDSVLRLNITSSGYRNATEIFLNVLRMNSNKKINIEVIEN